MYLEISARRSGKTTRLLEALNTYLEEDASNKAIIVTFSGHAYYALIRKYLRNNDRCFSSLDFANNLLNIKNPQEYRFFYDEFDHAPDTFKYIDLNGWYCTTPKKLRGPEKLKRVKEGLDTDFLLELLIANKFKYVAYTMNENLFDIIEDWKLNLSENSYTTEILANIWKVN